jgi:hypothetical protein
MLAGITEINAQITQLAPVLNSTTLAGSVRANPDNPQVPIATMFKRHGDHHYLFAVAMRPGKTQAQFLFAGGQAPGDVEVLGENRTLSATPGGFTDEFSDWAVHLYRIRLKP